MLRAPVDIEIGLDTYSARDEFNQASGNLAGKVLPVGGTWGSAIGDTDDFQVSGSGLLTRNTTSDTGIGGLGIGGRAVAAGTTSLASVVAQVDFKRDSVTALGTMGQGLMLRWVDANNFFTVFIDTKAGLQLWVYKVVATAPILIIPGVTFADNRSDTWRTLRISIDAAGNALIWLYFLGSQPGSPLTIVTDPVLATGGTLATGKVGLIDLHDSTGNTTRTYNDFYAWAPTRDAVVNPSRSCQLATDGMVRENSTGGVFAPVSWVERDLPRLPVSGQEGRTVQFLAKPSRGDFDALPDSGIDDASARGYYRPCWLFVPTGTLLDDFSTDTLTAGLWTVDIGAGTISVSGGQLVPSTTGNKQLRRVDRTFQAAEVTMKILTGSAVAGFGVELFLGAPASGVQTYLCANLDGTSLDVAKREAGTFTNLATTPITPATATNYWLRLRRGATTLAAELFTSAPTPSSTPTLSVTHTLSAADQAAFPIGTPGYAGFFTSVDNTSERYDDFSVTPT